MPRRIRISNDEARAVYLVRPVRGLYYLAQKVHQLDLTDQLVDEILTHIKFGQQQASAKRSAWKSVLAHVQAACCDFIALLLLLSSCQCRILHSGAQKMRVL
jgi:hypothetical protein